MYLLQNESNNVILTLSESTTISATTPYFLFEFVSPVTKASTYFTAPDESTNIIRYNKFNFTLTGGTQNLTAGTVTLIPDGRWSYNVYQMSGQTNLNLTGVTGGPIDSGYAQISGTTGLNYVSTSYTGTGQSYQYYKG